MKTAYELLPCTSSELAAIRGCTVLQANSLLQNLVRVGLAKRGDVRVQNPNGWWSTRYEVGRERHGNIPTPGPRMLPVRTESQWRSVYNSLVYVYFERARQAVLERATHFRVT